MNDTQYVMIVKKGMFFAGPHDVNGRIPVFVERPENALPMTNTGARSIARYCGLTCDDSICDDVDFICVDVADMNGKLRITGLTANRDLKRYVYRRKGAESFQSHKFWSREEAVAAAWKPVIGVSDYDMIETARIRTYEMADFADGHAENIIKQMICEADEIGGDAADDFLRHLTKKEKDDMEYVVRNSILHWAKHHGIAPHFFDVDDIQEHTRPVEQSIPPAPPLDETNRGTGRTTALMLHAIANALEHPDEHVEFRDHYSMDYDRVGTFHHLIREMTASLGLTIDTYIGKGTDDKNVVVLKSPISRMRDELEKKHKDAT